MPNPEERILCPEFQWAPVSSGMRLWTFGAATFEFRDRGFSDLRELVTRAVAAVAEP